MPEGSFVFVNRDGKRFMPENTSLIHRKAPWRSFLRPRARGVRNLPAYMVFDEAYRRKGRLPAGGTFPGDVGRPGGLPLGP